MRAELEKTPPSASCACRRYPALDAYPLPDDSVSFRLKIEKSF